MYKKEEPTNAVAWTMAAGTVTLSTTAQYLEWAGVNPFVPAFGVALATAFAKKNAFKVCATTLVLTSAGVVGGDLASSWQNTAPKNVLILPETKDQKAKIPAYKFETI